MPFRRSDINTFNISILLFVNGEPRPVLCSRGAKPIYLAIFCARMGHGQS
jgi:hypothetical protein